MSNKYKFKILREEVETEDFYEDKTHEKIKNSLFELIKSEEEGITIGLAGQWGSGKSTIINLLKKEKDFLFFYFDAWAHEGDPLRRIFLESFINCLKDSEKDDTIIDKLENKRAIISREKRTKTIEIKRATTKLGLWLAITTFIFTIGIALLSSINYDNITLKWTGKPNFPFYIGILFSFSPFCVLIKNYFVLKKQKKDINDLSNWAFLQNNSDETITEDIIGEDERSSIEFEKYFKEILEITNSDNPKKIIIVLDNLDRVDAQVSLKIWSTLQTFIQHKNPTSKDYKIFKNIFTLIPYDEESLMKIWENFSENEDGSKVIDNGFAKSFFDKSFQVRIDVPKPIVSNWLGFIDIMLKQAFQEWTESDKKSIKEVIEKTRKDILDNPRPREIKTYLNQVGFLRNHFPEDISTKSIAFYSFKRYLQGKSNNQISEYLLNINKIPVEEINLIEEDTIQEISAIIYGVNKENGAQILLSPKIIHALNNNKPEVLEELQTNYKNVFWAIFKKIISDTNEFRDFIRYSTPLNSCRDEFGSEIGGDYILLMGKYLYKELNYNYLFDRNFSNDIKNASVLFFKYNKVKYLEGIWNLYLKVYLFHENKSEGNQKVDNERVELLVDTLHFIYINTKVEFKTKVIDVDYDSWIAINKQTKFLEILHLIHPSSKIISLLSNEIKAGSEITEDIFNLINSYLNSGANEIDVLSDNLVNHFKWNKGVQVGDVFNYRSIALFENLFYKYQKEYDFEEFLKIQDMYSVCHFLESENNKLINMMSTICAIYFKDKLINFDDELTQNNQYSIYFIQSIKRYWETSDLENAKYTYKKLVENGLTKYVWDWSRNEKNLLCLDIIDLIILNHGKLEFNIEDPFGTIITINNIDKEDFDISKVIIKFFENSNLLEQILKKENLDIISNDYVLYEILKITESKLLIDKIQNAIINLDELAFKNSLESDDYIQNILLELKSKNNNFKMGHELSEALYNYVYGSLLVNNPVFNITKWQKDNWSKILQLLDETHFDNFCNRISKLIVDEKENLKEEFYQINDKFINRNIVIDLLNKEIEILKLYLQQVLQNQNELEKFKYIDLILKLENESKKKIKFGREFHEIISPIIKSNSYSDEINNYVKIIAQRFSIKE